MTAPVPVTPVAALANTGSDGMPGLVGGLLVLLTGLGLTVFIGIRRRLGESTK